MFSRLAHGSGKSSHSWRRPSFPLGKKFSFSAHLLGICASQKSNCQPGLMGASIRSLGYLETTGAVSRSPTTRVDRSLIPARWSVRSRRTNCRRHAPICACVFQKWRAPRCLRPGFASMKTPRTTILFWIAIPKRENVWIVEPVSDPSAYPPLTEVREKYLQLREQNLKLLESLSEEDLDKPTKAPPEGRELEFATYGQSFLVLALHQTMHRGNVTDARRAPGRATATRAAN